MTSLSDYLGRLVAEVATARAQADLESARIAELYRTHPLLSGFPVPRFRLPTVRLEVPLSVEELPSAPAEPSREDIRLAVRDALATTLRHRGASLSENEWATVEATLEEQAERLADDPRARASDLFLADALSGATAAKLPKRLMAPVRPDAEPQAAAAPLAADLREVARMAGVRTRTPVPRIHVRATAAELAAVDPGAVMRIAVTLTEEGVEWSGEDRAQRLVPE